jgi:hypothetical protein
MRRCLGALPLLLAAALLGCQAGSSVELVPVRGQALLQGKPLAGIAIQLVPDGAKGTNGPTGLGQTDENGAFQISSPPHGDGAMPGRYKVTVASYGGNFPKHYTDPRYTPLSIDVPQEGLDNWKLELKSQ